VRKKIIVLGCGLVGRAIAEDLAKDHNVKVVDISQQNLKRLGQGIDIELANLNELEDFSAMLKDFDLVVGAVPGYMGFETLKKIIEAGNNVVDISFFPEDPFELDELAKKKNVTAIMDCGVAPGIDNILLGYHSKNMEVEKFVCYVGGLPLHPKPPYNYKAPFSPIDVLEEYTRPARIVIDGKEVVKEALSEPEIIDFGKAGKLEAFNTDGLRSLIKTMPSIPNMIEKTLRYPGHISLMQNLKDGGFLSSETISVNGKNTSAMELTASILFPQWKLEEEEQEFTVMRVIIEGVENEENVRYEYNLYDEYDNETKVHSMARTTGYTCTAAANMVLSGGYNKIGISPPEYLGFEKANMEFMIEYLEERGVVLRKKVVE